MEYLHFTIRLESESHNQLRALVVSSAGEGGTTLALEPFLDIQRGVIAALQTNQSNKRSALTKIGNTLFYLLFSGPVLDLYHRSLGILHKSNGIRILVRLRGNDPETAFLASLPWELLRDPAQDHFLALDGAHSILRHLERPEASAAAPISLPLRILTIGRKRVLEMFAADFREVIQSGRVELHSLWRTTPEQLREALRKNEINILQIVGQGRISDTGNSEILLEGEGSSPLWLDSDHLTGILRNIPSLRLVMINASSAGSTNLGGLMATIATALVARSVPAVVATQFPMNDLIFGSFCNIFYYRLASGDSVDAALHEGRLWLYRKDGGEWAAPALYMGIRGDLFTSEGQSARAIPKLQGVVTKAIATELGTVPSETAALKARLEGAAVNNVQAIENAFDGAQEATALVLRQIEAAYEQTRTEAKRWSSASLIAAGCGLVMIIATLVSLLLGKSEIGTITAIGSLVPTVISGLFFTQLASANRRLGTMVEELTATHKMHFAQEIAKTMETPGERDRAKAAVLLAALQSGAAEQEKRRPTKKGATKSKSVVEAG